MSTENKSTKTVAEYLPFGLKVASAWSWRILLVGACIAVLVVAISYLRFIVIPLLVALLFAALLFPFIEWLMAHRWPKWLAITVSVTLVIIIIAGLMYAVVMQFLADSSSFEQRSVEAYQGIKDFLLASPLHLTDQQINDFWRDVMTRIQEDGQFVITGALSVGSTIGQLLTGFVLALVSLIFILIDGRGVWRWIVGVLPRRARQGFDGAGRAGWSTLQNFIKVQILVATIDAIGIAVGAALLGVPMAIPIGVVVFLGSFVPMIGAVVTGALAVGIALLYNGIWVAVAMLGIVIFVQQFDSHVLQPVVMGQAVKIHPLAVVLGVAAGTMVAGIAGALFAVPTIAVLNSMIKYLAERSWTTTPAPPPQPADPVA